MGVKNMQRKIGNLIVVLGIFVLLACAGSVPLKPEKRASIQSISINHHVQVPDAMYYSGPEYALHAYGVIGDIFADYIQMKNHEIIKDLMKKNDIHVVQIVRDHFTNEMERNTIFKSIVSEGGDAEFALSVLIYGFANELSGKLKPMLGVTGSLTEGNTVLWKKYAYITNFNDTTPPNTLEQFVANPELIRYAFESAAQIVVEDLCNHMQGK
jgi:hypothetical protein